MTAPDPAAEALAKMQAENTKLREAVERAYGLLWHASCNRLQMQVVVARRMLLDAMDGEWGPSLKEGQKRGIAFALHDFGEPSSDNPIERFMMEKHARDAMVSS